MTRRGSDKGLAAGDFVGDYGVTFIKRIKDPSTHHLIAELRCSCGTIFTARLSVIKRSEVKSCGCARRIGNPLNIGKYDNAWIKTNKHVLDPVYQRMVDEYGDEVGEVWRSQRLPFFQWVIEALDPYKMRPEDITSSRVSKIDVSKDLTCSNAKLDLGMGAFATTRKARWIVHGKKFISLFDAASYCGVSRSTISKWCKGYSHNGVNVPPIDGCGYLGKLILSDGLEEIEESEIEAGNLDEK